MSCPPLSRPFRPHLPDRHPGRCPGLKNHDPLGRPDFDGCAVHQHPRRRERLLSCFASGREAGTTRPEGPDHGSEALSPVQRAGSRTRFHAWRPDGARSSALPGSPRDGLAVCERSPDSATGPWRRPAGLRIRRRVSRRCGRAGDSATKLQTSRRIYRPCGEAGDVAALSGDNAVDL